MLGCLSAMLLCVACRHIPDEKARQGAQIHYDLGVQAQQAGENQGAYREYRMALELDPSLADAHNAIGILLHLVYRKPEEAIQHYQKALEIRPTFSEARVNLANVYLSEEQYEPAIKLYEEALNDMLYPTPYIAQNNLGWALFKKGETAQALDNIRSAVTVNPKFCQGYRNLALIYESQKQLTKSCYEWQRFGEACPDQPEPVYRRGMCAVKLGDREGARKAFTDCVNQVKDAVVKDECRIQLEQLTGRERPPR
jgi:Tfp pilus assembly protein PilF